MPIKKRSPRTSKKICSYNNNSVRIDITFDKVSEAVNPYDELKISLDDYLRKERSKYEKIKVVYDD